MSQQLIILSGLSGSGKTTVLHTLEDLGFYCVDNLPASILGTFVEDQLESKSHSHLAVSIDVRNSTKDFSDFQNNVNEIKNVNNLEVSVVFLDAKAESIIRRFKETRRKHPLQSQELTLEEAIELERHQLEGIIQATTLRLDTSDDNVHGLGDRIRHLFDPDNQANRLLVRLTSFGFKNGAPSDADFVFDARHLPNPHWEAALREYTGQSPLIEAFFASYPEVEAYKNDIVTFLMRWIPRMNTGNRHYLTIAIGCTGGKHRSVYLIESLAKALETLPDKLVVHHRDCVACKA